MGNVFVETVGCPKNQEDSERMAGLLAASGHCMVFDPEGADVIIINTCGFIEAAKRESIETFFEYTHYKDEGKRLIMTGCLAQRYAGELAAELSEADAIFGVNDYEKLPRIVSELMGDEAAVQAASHEPALAVSEPAHAPFAKPALPPRVYASESAGNILTVPRKALTPRHSSYIKVAEGCSNNCAYCTIPAIRGPYVSVPMERVLAESELLAAEGCKELILIAQDVTWYGMDLYGRPALPELLGKICAHTAAKSIEWIRLLYCYEDRVTDELLDVMASEAKILKYIDIPIQHVSDRLLLSMRRTSTGGSIRDTIGRLRRAMPDIAIRTTLITGLPGEGERDFEELYGFVEETRFDRLGIFAYSAEDGTDAALMPGQVENDIAEARRDAIMRLQQRISLEKNEGFIGTVQRVIVDGRDEGGAYVGRTKYDAPEIDGEVIFQAPQQRVDEIHGGYINSGDVNGGDIDGNGIIGKIVNVRVTDAMDYDLVGELVADGQEALNKGR